MSMAQGMAPQGMAQGVAPRDSHQTTQRVTTQLKDIKKTLPLRVLSPEDFHHWQTRGYVIVRKCGAAGQCRAAQGFAVGI